MRGDGRGNVVRRIKQVAVVDPQGIGIVIGSPAWL
jgi:hypothetical protein